MSKNKEVSNMFNTMKKSFSYLSKIKQAKQKRKSINFFRNFITDQLSLARERHSMLIHQKQSKDQIIDSFEDLLIRELEKPIIGEDELKDIISYKKDYRNRFNYLKDRNIDMMLFLLKHFNRCRRYIRMNSFTDELLRILVSLSTTEHFTKGSAIYTIYSKSNSFYFVIKGSVSIKTLDPIKIKEEFGLKTENNKNKKKNNEKGLDKDKMEIEKFFEEHEKENASIDVSKDYLVSKSKSSFSSCDKNKREINEKKKNNNFIDIKNYKNNEFEDESNEEKEDMNIYNSFSSEDKKAKRKKSSKIKKKDTLINRIQKIKENKLKRRRGNIFNIKNITNRLLNQDLINLQKNLGHQIKVYNQGSFFGEWDLIYDRPHPNSAYAEEETDLLILDKEFFDKYFLKHISKADVDRKYFITKRIPLLKIENLPNLHPEFFDKGSIIYTNFDKALEFFIIYQGQGALKQIKKENIINIRNKNDIYKNKNKLETICVVDKGCIVGLETGKKTVSYYENIFMIIEDNTVIYRVSMVDAVSGNSSYKLQKSLKEFLYDLYCKQNSIFQQIIEKKIIKNKISTIKKEIQKTNHENDTEKNEEKIIKIFEEEAHYNINNKNIKNYHYFILKTQSFGSFDSLKNKKNKNIFNLKEKFPKIKNNLNYKKFLTISNKIKRRNISDKELIEIKKENKNKNIINNNFFMTSPNYNYRSSKSNNKLKDISNQILLTLMKDKSIKRNNSLKKIKNNDNMFLNYAKNSVHLNTWKKSRKNILFLKKNNKAYNSYKNLKTFNININNNINTHENSNFISSKNTKLLTMTSNLSIQTDENNTINTNITNNTNNENLLFINKNLLKESIKEKKIFGKTNSLINFKRKNLGKGIFDQYICTLLKIPKRNNYYNSGNFNVPLIGKSTYS